MNAKPHMLKGLVAAAAIALTAAGVAPPAQARQAEIYTPLLSNLALSGYDAVAYFDQGRPVMGLAQFSTDWKGAQFRFVSAAHLARFKANPAAYAPQYGGYCAWAVSQGHTAKGDPTVWKLVGGKLYLNYDAAVQQRWQQDIPGNIGRADRNWPQVLR
ncbi:YHS domain-containing (seleno)protein [Caulobacter sp. KR2-114]|uniref:YHS domain-containing (seleno)protein n=1 Tax=Caulobacter sp. KR2-114 TaxID=3400912 RepID=UPI003C08CE93